MRCSVLPFVGAIAVLAAPRAGVAQVAPVDSGAKVRVQLVALAGERH